MAARVAAQATPGAAALTADTLRSAEGFVNAAPLGGDGTPPVQGAVRLYSLSGRAAPRSRWDVRAARGLTRFHGREAELESLGRALRRAGKGHGEVVAALLEGGREAGRDVSAADTWSLADLVPSQGLAVVALIEHLWAGPLSAALHGAGATLLEETWLSEEDRTLLGSLAPRRSP